MKKTISILLMLMLLFGIASFVSASADAPYFKLYVNRPMELDLVDENPFPVTISVSDFSEPINGIFAFEVFFCYPIDLEYIGGISEDPTNRAEQPIGPGYSDELGNYVRLSGMYLSDLGKDQLLFTLTFKLSEYATTGDRTFKWIPSPGLEPYGIINGNTYEPYKPGDIVMSDLAFKIIPPNIPVTSITGVPTSGIVGTGLNLTGTVNPTNATNKTIVWSIVNAGSTGATLTGSVLSVTAAGTVTVRATIVNGLLVGDYSQDFPIAFGEDGEIKIIIGGNTVYSGWPISDSTINIPIKFTCEGSIFEVLSAGYDFSINYDPAMLEFTGPVVIDDGTVFIVINRHADDPIGTLRVACTPIYPLSLNLAATYELTVPFKVIGSPILFDTTALKLSKARVLRENAWDGDYPDVEARDVILTFASGLLMGDINGDGLITPEDAMLLLQMYVGLIPWTEHALLVGDVNNDGVIDATDAAMILRMVVGS